MKKTTEQRFWEKVNKNPGCGCWEWIGGRSGVGYGIFMDGDGVLKGAHRVSFTMHKGDIPNGLDLDHLCRVRHCVNPAHLEPVTRRENINRGIVAEVHRARFAKITHCPSGHPYAGDNLTFGTKGDRRCKACGRIRTRARRAAK